ncbi:MAG: D-alanyl-D-alanine carboxypeptidase, partial [Candidatus Magasanikbacteria bacterium]|nr:D-alanyl-D-alanine carboxypeptidase [Candidatus Magasanikbacteria bacterium]
IKFKDGTVFRVEGTSRIYVVEHGKRRHIPQEIFTNLGYKESVIITVDKQSSRIHKDGTSIRIYTQTNPKVETPSENTPTNITPEEPTDEKDEDDPLLITPAHETTYIGTSINNDIQAYAIVDYDTGEILAGKNVDVQRPIASLTKIMTAYRLAKEGIKQDATITYNRRKHQSAYSYYRIAEGEQVKVHDLFDAMLVSSLNIPPRMLVSHIEPDEQKFINRMNDQANTWRLPNTNFTEPAGIDPNNVSTAREYAQLFKAATKTRIVKTFAAKKSYTYTEVKDIDDRPDHQDVHTNDLVNKDGLTFTIIASKTGYLHKAGACLTMIIERKSDKKRFTIVTLGNPDKTDRFNEPERIANIAVNQF